jgi:hypothetical protein
MNPLLAPTEGRDVSTKGRDWIVRRSSPQAPAISRISNYGLIVRKEYCLNQDFQDRRIFRMGGFVDSGFPLSTVSESLRFILDYYTCEVLLVW